MDGYSNKVRNYTLPKPMKDHGFQNKNAKTKITF